MRYGALLIDGKNLLYRAMHGARDLTTEIGGETVQVGGVYQFLRSALLLWESHAAAGCQLIVCWEGGELERKKRYPAYKNRERNPVAEAQEKLLRTILIRLGWQQLYAPGWEADDVIATLAKKKAWSLGDRQYIGIYTGDADLHQCVTDRVHVIATQPKHHDLADGTSFRPGDVLRRWGVEGARIPDIKALTGDTSDNIPGAKGIGEKWATPLIVEHGGLEQLIEACRMAGYVANVTIDGKIKRSQAHAATICRQAEELLLFKELCTVNSDVNYVESARRYDASRVEDLLRGLRFASLLAPSTLKVLASMAANSRQ